MSRTMGLDDILSAPDVAQLHHVVIDADPARVYALAIDADLAQAAHRSRAVAALLAARATPTRLARRLRHKGARSGDAVRISRLPDPGEWVGLAEDFGREVVFGAIGRVGARSVRWRQIHSEEYEGFAEPGYAKVAANLALRPAGDGRTVLSFEIRARGTEAASRRRLGRYWRFASPLIGRFMRGVLAYVAEESERPYSAATPPPSRVRG